MNDRQKGFYRDREILEAVSAHRCLNTDQVQAIVFKGMKSGRRKAQMRLKRLVERERLNRWRYDINEPYAYYVGRKPEQAEHVLGVNWLVTWLINNVKDWESVHSIQREHDYRILRTDATVIIRNNVTGGLKVAFLEYDRSDNKFDKVAKYNALYEAQESILRDEWWLPQVKRFPPIIVATSSSKRIVRVRDAIKNENSNGLEFKAYLLDDLKKGVVSNA